VRAGRRPLRARPRPRRAPARRRGPGPHRPAPPRRGVDHLPHGQAPRGVSVVERRARIRDIVTPRRLVISLLLAVALGALLASEHAHHDVNPTSTYPAAIAAVYPRPGTPSIERQTAI